MPIRRILIIDDEERIREVVRACLEDLCGWVALVAESGSEALHQAEFEAVDAILLDVSMPDMDGFTLFERLQANPASQSIPVILLTAKVLSHDQAQFAQMSVAGVIIKPFNPVTLCEQITAILGWSQ